MNQPVDASSTGRIGPFLAYLHEFLQSGADRFALDTGHLVHVGGHMRYMLIELLYRMLVANPGKPEVPDYLYRAELSQLQATYHMPPQAGGLVPADADLTSPLVFMDLVERFSVDRDMDLSRPQPLPDPGESMPFEVRDAAKVRRIMVDWLQKHGQKHYQFAINHDRQGLFPTRFDDPDAAKALAEQELHAMRAADLFFMDSGMCGLLREAYSNLPDFRPQRWMVPSDYGFALFAEPISQHHPNEAEAATMLQMLGGQAAEVGRQLAVTPTRTYAVLWRPYDNHGRWKHGGIWAGLYARSAIRLLDEDPANRLPVYARILEGEPPLTPDNECLLAWDNPDHAATGEVEALRTGMGTATVVRTLMAAFRLAGQRDLTQQETVRVPGRKLPKSVARRTGQREIPAESVRVIRYRSTVMDEARRAGEAATVTTRTAGGRTYRHRWIVRGFWRNTYYPTTASHEQQYIAPHVRGPEGAPLLNPERVYLLSAPQASRDV